jgi:hypothetical protein
MEDLTFDKASLDKFDPKKVEELIKKGEFTSPSFPMSETTKYDRNFIPYVGVDKDFYTQLREHRADKQSNWQAAGNMLGRGLVKAAISVVEPIGYIADIEQYTTDINKYEDEYGNWFNNWLIKQEENLDKAMPIYTKDEQPKIGSADWFLSNGDQIIKSMGYFVPGAVGAKLVGGAIKGMGILGDLSKASMLAIKGDVFAKSLLPVIALNYNEHMRSAVDAFATSKDKLYEAEMDKIGPELDALYNSGQISMQEYDRRLYEAADEARAKSKVDAADIASGLVQKGKANLALNMLEYTTLFKFMGGTRRFDDIATKALSTKGAANGLIDFLKVGGSEYLEEVNTGFFEKEAEREADIKSGKIVKDDIGINRYLEHANSYEGYTEGLSGFIGGSGMQTISNVMGYKAKNNARDIKKQIIEWSDASDDVKKQAFNNLQLTNLVDILQKANTNGVAGTAYNTLDAISKISQEDAAKLGLDNDYVEKATEFKDVAKVFEDTYNDLSIRNTNDPLAVSLLTNLKVNSFINKNQVTKQEQAIKEIEDGINNDIKSSPMFKAKTLDYKIAANTTLLTEIDDLYKEVFKDPAARTSATNETSGELESRSELIKKNLDTLYEEKAELLNKHLKSKYVKPEKVEGKEALPLPEYVVTKKDGKHKVSLVNQDEQAIKIHQNIVEDINKPTLDEAKLGISYHELELAKSTRDNSIKMFSELSNNPQMLDQVKAKINNIAKEEIDTYKSKIANAPTLAELNILDRPNLNPILKKEINKKKKEFETTKRKEDLAKGAQDAKAKTGTTTATPDTKTGQTVDAVIEDEVVDTTPFDISKVTSVQTPLTEADIPVVTDFITKTPIKVEGNLTLEDLNTNEKVYNAKISLLKHELESGKLTQEEIVNKSTEREALLTEKYVNDDKRRTAERAVRRIEEVVGESLNNSDNIIDARLLPHVKRASENIYKTDSIEDVLANVENLPDVEKAPYLTHQLQSNNLKLSILNSENAITKDVNTANQIVSIQDDINEIEATLQKFKPTELADPANVNDTASLVDERIRANWGLLSGSEPNKVVMGRTLRGGRIENDRPALYGYIDDPASSAAFLDRDYIESFKDESKQGRPMKHSITNENIERADFLKTINNVNDVTLEFEIDTESEFYKIAEEKAKATKDFENEFRDLVPIKIVAYDKQGKRHETGTYVHTTDWVAKNSNEGAVEQIKKIRNTRDKILLDNKSGVKTKGSLTGINKGNYSFNVMNENGVLQIDKKTNRPYLKEETLAVALPGLTNIAIGKDGNLHIDRTLVSSAQTAFAGDIMNGALYGIMEEPNGSQVAVPLYTKQLSDKKLRVAKDGIINSILTFYSDAPISQKASDATGLNKAYPSSIFKYLREMVYIPQTKRYDGKVLNKAFMLHRGDEIVIGNAKDGGAQVGYAAGIDKDGKSYFKVYKSNEQDTNVTSEQARELFTAKLQEVVPELNLSVKIDKLNKKQRFNVPFLTKSGNISETSLSYDSYETFLKNTLTTKLNGRTKLSNGKYTMFSQPNITFAVNEGTVDQTTTEITAEQIEQNKVKEEEALKANVELENLPEADSFEDPAVYNIPDIDSVIGTKIEKLTGRQVEEYKTSISNQLINMAFNNAMSEKVENMEVSVNYLKRKYNARLTNLKAIQDKIQAVINSTDVKFEPYRRLVDSLNIKTNEDAAKYIATYEDLILNWNNIAQLAMSRLNSLDMVDGQFEESFDDGVDMDVRIQYNAKLRLNVNPISYNKKFKFRLATVPTYTRNEKGEYLLVKDALGEVKYMDPDIVFNNLLELFADFEAIDSMQDLADSMIDKLISAVEINPEYKGIIEMFNSMTDSTNNNEKIANADFEYSLKTLFVNALSNTKVRLEKIISFKVRTPKVDGESTRGYEDNMRYVNVPINDVSGHKGVEKSWTEVQKSIGLFKGDGDRLSVDTELVNNVKQKFIDLRRREIEKFKDKEVSLKRQSNLEDNRTPKDIRESMQFVNETYLSEFVELLSELGIMTDTTSLFDGLYESTRAELADLIRKVQNPSYVKTDYDVNVIEPNHIRNPTSPKGKAIVVQRWLNNQANLETNPTSILSKLFDIMINPNLEVTWSTDNIFYGSEIEYKFIIPLAKATYKNNDKTYSLVSLDSENNNIYEIQKYNGLMKILGQIKSGQSFLLSDLAQTSFGKNHPFINELLTDADYLDNLDITFHDAVTTASVDNDYGNDNNTRENLNIRNQDLNYLLSFQASKGKYGKFIGLTFGDNPITPKFVSKIYDYSYKIKLEQYQNNKGQTFTRPVIAGIGTDAITHIMQYAEAEMARIISATNKKNNGVEFNGSEYNKFYDKFVMFNIFNYEELAKEISKKDLDIVYPNGVFSELPESKAILREVLTNHLTKNIEELTTDYLEYGILSKDSMGGTTTKDMDLSYLSKIRAQHQSLMFPSSHNNTVLHSIAVSHFYLNQYIANLNMHALFGRDLVHFAKGGNEYNHNLTLASVQKRLRPALTPWYTGRFVKPVSKIVVINDITLSTVDDLVEKGYMDQKIADGFEWSTTEDYINYLLAYDKISKSQHDRIMDKINKSHEDGTYDYTLDESDIDAMFVLKPISYDTALNTEDDTVYNFLTKSARFGLLPQLTKNYPELDKLRIFLEKKKIDRATFNSAAKTKSVNVLNVFDKDGNFREDVALEYDNTPESYDYFQHKDMNGINSFSPYGKDKITAIIQADRGLGATMMHHPEIAALIKEKDRIRVRQLELGKEKLIKMFDAVIGDDGIIRFRNLKKLKEILEREGHDRKWIDNSLDLLTLDENNRFDLSLLHNNYINKIQSVIFSIINKELVRHKITGNSMVQIPDFGKPKTKVLGDGGVDTYKNSIVYIDGITPGERLKFIGKSGDKVIPAQVIISWNFKDANGQLLDINQFIDPVTGRIDNNKLPKELLQGIAMRIPNQKHSSMMPFEIVGFLPSMIKDTVIVPNEIVAQMGSDFDIDKLYNYMKGYYYDSESQSLGIATKDVNLNTRIKELETLQTELKAELKQSGKFLGNIKSHKRGIIIQKIRAYEESLAALDDYDMDEVSSEVNKLDAILSDLYAQKDLTTDKEVQDALSEHSKISKRLKAVAASIQSYKKAATESMYLNNDYIQVHMDVLSKGIMYDKLTESLDMKDLEDAVNDVKDTSTQDINDHRYQRNSYISQQSGKKLLSTISLHVSMHNLIEPVQNVYLLQVTPELTVVPKEISIFEVDGKPLNLSYVSGIGTYKEGNKTRTNHDIIIMLQNAAVDNANNPILGYGNINDVTIGTALMLAYLKTSDMKSLPVKYIVEFLNQPIVKEYVKEVNEIMSTTANNLTKAKKQAIENLIAKYDPNQSIQTDDTSYSHADLKKMRTSIEINAKDKLNILNTLDDLNRYFYVIDNVRKAILPPSKEGLAQTYGQILYQEYLIKNYLESTNTDINNIKFVYKQGNNYTQSGHYTNEIVNNFATGIAELFGYDTKEFIAFKDKATKITDKYNIDPRFFENIISYYRRASLSFNPEVFGEPLTPLRKRMIEGTNSLAYRLEAMKEKINMEDDYRDLVNNKFLKSIYTRKDINGTGYSLIKTQYGASVGIDKNANFDGLNQMLTHPMKDVRDLAIDFIKYTFVMGQPFEANYQQDISYKYLKATGMLEALKETKINNDALFKLYIQNNPWLSHLLNNNKIIDSVIDKDTNLPVSFTTEYQPYIGYHYVKAPDNTYHLYQRNSFHKTNNGTIAVFVKIPTMGGVNIKGMKFLEGDITNVNGLSAFDVNNKAVNPDLLVDKSSDEWVIPIANLQLPNTNTSFSIDYLNNKEIEGISEVLKNVTDPKFKELANILSDILKGSNAIVVQEDNTINSKGSYSNKVIKLNTDIIKANKVSLDSVLLHETIHGVVSDIISKYLRKDYKDLTSAQIEALNRLDKIRTDIKSSIDNSPSYAPIIESYKDKNTKLKNKEGVAFTNDELFYYDLDNLQEFITGVLTRESTQRNLDAIQYSESKSILDKIKDYIKAIVTNFIKSAGIKITDGMALEASISSAIDVLQSVNVENSPQSNTSIKFEEDNNTGYAARTAKNASADATIALAYDFNSAGEKLTKSSVLAQDKKYLPVSTDIFSSKSEVTATAGNIAQVLNNLPNNEITLNIAGSGIYTLKGTMSQTAADNFTLELLQEVIQRLNPEKKIISIRTGGQTGFDEAGAKAGIKLGIPTTILAPKGWKFRTIDGKDISNEAQFKARFGTPPTNPQLSLFNDPNQQFDIMNNTEGIDYVFKQYPELSTIGTPQQYSQHLDSVFPNSLNKNILYHIGGKDIQKFDSEMFGKGEGTNASGEGVYFQENPYEIMNIGIGSDYFYESPTPIQSMLEDGVLTMAVANVTSNDSYNKYLQTPQEVVIRDVNRIHILGSNKDLQMFKDFVDNTTTIDYSDNAFNNC